MEVKANGASKTTKTGTPKSFLRVGIPGTPKKRVKTLKQNFSWPTDDSVNAPTTPLKIKTRKAVLAEIEKSSDLKKFYDQIKFYDQHNNNKALEVGFLRQLSIKPRNVCESEFIFNFRKEHPEVNGLPKPDPAVCAELDRYLQLHPEESFYSQWVNAHP